MKRYYFVCDPLLILYLGFQTRYEIKTIDILVGHLYKVHRISEGKVPVYLGWYFHLTKAEQVARDDYEEVNE